MLSIVVAFDKEKLNPCQDDISNVCGMPFPFTFQTIFDARLCLKSNSKQVSKECTNYLLNISPSIVEPCFEEIKSYCRNVSPGNNRLNTCLSKYSSSVNPQCANALTIFSNAKDSEIDPHFETKSIPKSNVYFSNLENLQSLVSDLSRYDIIKGANSAFAGFYDRLNEVEVTLQDIMRSLAHHDQDEKEEFLEEEAETEEMKELIKG
jgi:hypothetical protein